MSRKVKSNSMADAFVVIPMTSLVSLQTVTQFRLDQHDTNLQQLILRNWWNPTALVLRSLSKIKF